MQARNKSTYRRRKPIVRQSAPEQSVLQTGILADSSWEYVPGVAKTAEGIHIVRTGRAIVNQDGTDNQTNPPVNFAGPYLAVSGDFTVQTTVKQAVTAGARLRFYGAVPLIYDEWRYETPSVEVAVDVNGLTVRLWDGRSDNPRVTKSIAAAVSDEMAITLAREASMIRLYIGNVLVGETPDLGVFSSGKVWLGVEATKDSSGWDINGLTVSGMNGGSASWLEAPNLTAEKNTGSFLRNLVAATYPTKYVGTAVAGAPLAIDEAYRTLAIGQFNMWTLENELKPQFIHPSQGTYTFGEADLLVNAAFANNIAIHGHALVFGEANAAWVRNAKPADLQKIMTDHITTVVSHYKGKIREWDVVNEPLNDYEDTGDGLRHHLWYNAMGEQYIDIAFKAARAADPQADLYINDFGLEADDERWDEFVALLQRLQSRGVPIDGVGFQAHVYERSDQIDFGVLKAHFKQLETMGLKVRISEMDVTGDDSSFQASQYAGVFKICMEAVNCTAFSTWGLSDKYGSTTEYHAYPLEYGNDLLWSERLQAKSALAAITAQL